MADCLDVYTKAYNDFIAKGLSAADAASAAREAYAACLARSSSVGITNINIPGGRLPDPGPVRKSS